MQDDVIVIAVKYLKNPELYLHLFYFNNYITVKTPTVKSVNLN